MSDFLYSTRPCPRGALSAALRPWLRPLDVELEERHGPWGSLVVARPVHEPYALAETDDALTVVVGSPVVRTGDLPPALIGRGDRRARVHRALEDPRGCATLLDGQFAALRIEKRTGAGHVLTDRFAFVALFHAPGPDGGLLIGTHVDALAAAAGRAERIDLVSAADLCASYSSTWPWTLYEDVRQVAPASARPFDADGWVGEPEGYWRPWEPGAGPGAPEPSSLDELAETLRAALLESVEGATAEADRAALLLSGGEDSRAVLSAVPGGVTARGVVFAEWESREVRIARKVARVHGAQAEVVLRAPDHYARGFSDTTRLAGSGHLFIDIHGLGLAAAPPLDREPVVLGGLSADSLLKGGYAPAEPIQRFRSKRLPGLRPELLEAADERRNVALDRMRVWRPETAGEWLSLWPFSMRKHSGNVEGNRRMFRAWEAFHANGVLEVAAAARPDDARSGRLFRRAMRPLFAPSAWVPHAEYRFPYLGPAGNALALLPLALARGIRALATGEVRARHRPWPKWRVLAASPAMRSHDDRLPVAADARAGLFETDDPGAIDAARGEWYALRRLMLTQLGEIVRIHREAD